MSDEVSDFLRSVEELKERREQEDEARAKELEEKFLRERSERQARRAGEWQLRELWGCLISSAIFNFPPFRLFPPTVSNLRRRQVGALSSGQIAMSLSFLCVFKSHDVVFCLEAPPC